MLQDLSWLSQEAKNIHALLQGLFYVFATVLLCLGIFMEYFKWPLGQMPSFTVLLGRVLIACILLVAYPHIANTIAGLSDELAHKIGGINQFDLIRAKLWQRFHLLSWSWVNLKEDLVIVISYLIFLFFHFSLYAMNAFIVYAWILMYVFSPLLIALYVLPQTAGATKALFRSLIEVSAWKIVWAVLAILLWSSALSDINKTDFDFLSVLCLSLILAISLLLTPLVVHALCSGGIAGVSSALGGLTVATSLPALKIMQYTVRATGSIYRLGMGGAGHAARHGMKARDAFRNHRNMRKKSDNPSSLKTPVHPKRHKPSKPGEKK